jgi:hypothetical protein
MGGGGVKRPECEADHSPPSYAEAKNYGAIPPFPHMSSWRDAWLINHTDNLTFTNLTDLENVWYWRCTLHAFLFLLRHFMVRAMQPVPTSNTHSIFFKVFVRRAIAHAVSLWLPTSAAARVWAQVRSCWICGKWRWGRFSPSTSVSPANLHSTNCSTTTIIYHLGLIQ